MNTVLTTNQRLVTILFVLLIVFVVLLNIWIIARFLLMGPRMMGGMMSMNGQTMNDMMAACADMMKNFQSP